MKSTINELLFSEDKHQYSINGDILPSVTEILRPKKVSDELTSRLHCAIRCVANQIEWAGDKLSEEEWKLLFVAALFGQRVVASPNGSGFIVLQKKTRSMSGNEKFDLLEYVYSFGSVRGVIFDEN